MLQAATTAHLSLVTAENGGLPGRDLGSAGRGPSAGGHPRSKKSRSCIPRALRTYFYEPAQLLANPAAPQTTLWGADIRPEEIHLGGCVAVLLGAALQTEEQ